MTLVKGFYVFCLALLFMAAAWAIFTVRLSKGSSIKNHRMMMLLFPLGEFIVNIGKWTFVVLIVLLLWPILASLPVSVLNVADMFDEYNTAFSLVIGAFLATVSGLFVHVLARYCDERRIKRKYGKMLHNDLLMILRRIELLQVAVKASGDHPEVFWHVQDEILFDPDWRENYAQVSDRLPVEYYERMNIIYAGVNLVNSAIQERKMGLLQTALGSIRKNEPDRNVLGMPVLSNYDLLHGLDRIAHNKKFPDRIIRNLLLEIRYQCLKRQYSIMIENKAISILHRAGRALDESKLSNEVREWMREERPKEYNKIGPRFNRLVFEVLFKSQKLNQCGAKSV